MNYLDYLIILVVVIGFLLGFKDGLVRKIIGLIGFVVAIALAFELSVPFGKMLLPLLNNDDYLAGIVAGILIFLVVIFITSVLKRIIHPLDKVNRFINQMLGGFIGIIQILFFLSGFLLFLNIFNVPDAKDKDGSMLYNQTFNIIPASLDLVIGHKSKATDFIKEYLDKKDTSEIQNVIDSLKVNGVK